VYEKDLRLEGGGKPEADDEDLVEEAADRDRRYEAAREQVLAAARAKPPGERTAWERFELRCEATKDEDPFGAGRDGQTRRAAYLARHGVKFDAPPRVCSPLLRPPRRLPIPPRPSRTRRFRERRRTAGRRGGIRAGPGDDGGSDPEPGEARREVGAGGRS
jgi:hypothetical protein